MHGFRRLQPGVLPVKRQNGICQRAFGLVVISLAGLLVCIPNTEAQTTVPPGKSIKGSSHLSASIKPNLKVKARHEIKVKARQVARQQSGTTKSKNAASKNTLVKASTYAGSKTIPAQSHAVPIIAPPSVPPPASPAPVITSFFQDTKDWLRAGEIVHVTLLGTEGGQAAFHISGVSGSFPMQEGSPGTYIGTWRVPSDKLLPALPAVVSGELNLGGRAALPTQTARPVCVDMIAPTAQNFVPAPGTTLPSTARLIISADLTDQGSGIDPNSVRLLLNGHDITGQANISSERIEYRPLSFTGTGEQIVQISCSDRAGNLFEYTWRFTITAP